MRFSPTHDGDGGRMIVASAENCDTDAWPLVPEVEFRRFDGAPDPELGAVAAAILFARHCGAVAEFDGVKVGIDAARAIRRILPDVEELFPIDGMKREIGQGVATLIVGEARRMFDGGGQTGRIGKSARAVTWGGDFVTPARRDSTRYIGGDIFTNAALVAGSTEISAALALLVGGREIRDIYVPPPAKSEEGDFERIADGLEFISVKLRSL